MDSITQATLGAAIGHALLGKKIGGKAAVLGALVATIPDLDVVLLPFYDSLQRISIHRGYSHSILFSVLGALLLAYIFGRIKLTKQFSFLRLFIFSWLSLFTHMLLDACTAYGTQLFLPFSDHRVSFDNINIVDPLYTLPLLLGLLISVYRTWKKENSYLANIIGLAISSLYLIFTLAHKQYVNAEIQSEFSDQGIKYEEYRTIPVGIASLDWYGVAKASDTLTLGKYSSLRDKPIDFHSFPINDYLLETIDLNLKERLKWFSKGFYTVAEQNDTIRLYNLQCDMQGVRYFGDYKAPTAFYFEIIPHSDGTYDLSTGMHNNK